MENKERIPCVINSADLCPEFIDVIFDEGECLSHNGTYIGFVDGKPVHLLCHMPSDTIHVLHGSSRKVLDRINEMFEEMNREEEDSEYYRKAYGIGDITIKLCYVEK